MLDISDSLESAAAGRKAWSRSLAATVAWVLTREAQQQPDWEPDSGEDWALLELGGARTILGARIPLAFSEDPSLILPYPLVVLNVGSIDAACLTVTRESLSIAMPDRTFGDNLDLDAFSPRDFAVVTM